ncbi:ATP-binding protein [Amycolatopsis sp. NPDC102389]|uniref:ATP-binding protein n=1 Tax=Amycolatopsis sp. NPDC102389 TaxID=3363941 RepID=UPI0037F22BFA
MSEGRDTTHDWADSVDAEHLARIRRNPGEFAPGGVAHLVLEVLAYAAEEAETTGGHGGFVKKPVMSTKDLRFFDFPGKQWLPDGHARRGVSVVAALSDWLVHTNRRHNGSWTQRYERGVPVTDLSPIPDDGTTGTTVRFLPGEEIGPVRLPEVDGWPYLSVECAP